MLLNMNRSRVSKRSRLHTADDSDDSDEEEKNVVRVYKHTIYYRGGIQEPHATDFCIALRKMEDELWDTGGCITVRLTSNGGSVFAGMCMYDAIRQCNVRVRVVAEGFVASAATFVMLGSTERAMSRTSVLLVHAISTWMVGRHKPKDLKEELLNCETLMRIITDLYRNQTSISETELKKLFDTDLYMCADDCMCYGFVTEIV
jgi:ATP-dependent protease ClpP protease subunit